MKICLYVIKSWNVPSRITIAFFPESPKKASAKEEVCCVMSSSRVTWPNPKCRHMKLDFKNSVRTSWSLRAMSKCVQQNNAPSSRLDISAQKQKEAELYYTIKERETVSEWKRINTLVRNFIKYKPIVLSEVQFCVFLSASSTASSVSWSLETPVNE